MFFSADLFSSQPDALAEVLAVSEDFDVIQAVRYGAIDRMREEFFAAFPGVTGTEHEMARRSLRLELAAALRITEHAAEVLIDTAEGLVQKYPDAVEALGQGRISDQHARLIVSKLAPLPTEMQEALASDALALAEEFPVGVFRRKLDALIETAQQSTIEERHAEAVTRRRTDLIRQPDRMATLQVYAPEVELTAAYGRAVAMAKAIKADQATHSENGDTRTLDQIITDVVCDLLIDGDTTVHPDTARGIRATVAVTVPALSLLEDTDDTGASGTGTGGTSTDDAGAEGNGTEAGETGGEGSGSREVGETRTTGITGTTDAPTVEGIGPIPLAQAKELCGGASDWMRILTHPETGIVLSAGRTQYRPPASLRRLVKWRSERCMAPGCSIPASRCEIDHTIAWADGGTTELQNLTPLCKGHHTLKHHGNWVVKQLPDSGGVIEWTSPTGRRYLVEPERRVPVFRPDPAPF